MILDRRQLRLLLPLGAAISLSLTGDSTLYAVLAHQTELVGISLGAVGVLLGINRLIRVPGNPLAGVLYDRRRRRRLFLFGLVLGILSTFSYSIVRGFWPFFAARLLWGAAWALINVGGYTMVLDWTGSTDRGRMTGFYQVAYLLGLSISPILGGALTDAVGFRSAVRICAGISGVGLVAAVLALPEVSPAADRLPARGAAGATHQVRPFLQRLQQVDRRVWRVGYIYLVVFFVGNGVLMSTVSLYLGQRWGSEIGLAGLTIGVASLAGVMLALRAALGIIGGPVAGVVSDWLGNRWPVVRVGIVLGMAGFLLLAAVDELWAAPLGVALVSLSGGASVAVLTALVGDLADAKRQGVTVGLLAAAGDIGSATGPLLAYALALAVSLRCVYLLCAAALVTALAATVGQKVRQTSGKRLNTME